MRNLPVLKDPVQKITFALLFIVLPVSLFAQEAYQADRKKQMGFFGGGSSSSAQKEDQDNLSGLQKEARLYRRQGTDFQRQGDLDSAMAAYQKAIIVDPAYAVAYNDLGVVYEAIGYPERAKEMYTKAIQVNPNYLSAYSNLALLCENERDLEQAIFYWDKRVMLGDPEDPWTEKARQRLNDIRAVLSSTTGAYATNEDLISTLKSTLKEKEYLRASNANLAKDYFTKAKRAFAKGDDVTAFKLSLDALQLEPDNAEIAAFLEKVQKRSLAK